MPAAPTTTRFLPKADAAILTFTCGSSPPLIRPQTVGPILDPENLDKPIKPWSKEIEASFYPSPNSNAHTATICGKPPGFNDRYLRAFLPDNERLRLSMLWYYTRDVLKEDEFLSGLQEKAHFAQESTGWEFVVIGILDVNVYIRLATVGLQLSILPRGETLCAHTITRPPGSVFLLPDLQEDWRFRTCPYLEQGGLYAYAGVPLRLQHESGDCVSLGSLCVASSKSEDPLTKDQQQALVRLADWIVSDLVQCARARRQRDRHQMSELLSKAHLELEKVGSEEPVIRILRATYPNATIKLQPIKTTYVELEGRHPILISDLEGGLWEDVEYLDTLIADFNHEALPTTKTVRVIAGRCESASGSSLLIVASKNFHFIFDDVDSWFVQTCAGQISQMWRKRLLVEAIEAKEKFLRGFSHQLRTPIHGILGSVDLLVEELQGWKSTEFASPVPTSIEKASSLSLTDHSKHLDIIKMGGRDLISIINNMITLNRWADIAMTDRHYAMHAVDKLEAELCTAILSLTAGDTRYKSAIFFTHDFPRSCESLWMDIDVLRDSLLPLVCNAVQHTPDGIVSVHSSVNQGTKQLIIDIKDNGRGIQQNDQRRIFEPYEKVDMHSAHAGLGLTLASRFAALLHGSVALMSSNIGRGSHFRATFRDVECVSKPHFEQPLASKFPNLPSKFFNLMSNSNDVSLCDCFIPLLTRNGFTPSDHLEDSFIILDAAPNIEEHRTRLSQIPSGMISICLVPGLEADPPSEQTVENMVYASGPFSTGTLSSILEQADKLLLEIKPSVLSISQPGMVLPVIQKHHVPKPNENTETHQLTIGSGSSGLDATALSQSNHDTATSVEVIIPTPISRLFSTSSQPITLIVDDNTVNLRVMEMYCKKRGLPYKSAKDGVQALEIFSQHQSSSATSKEPLIELILMDLQMPVCNGIEATQQIRALERLNHWAKSLVLVMTGQDTVADKIAAKEAGGDGYFVKPVLIQQLDRVIKQRFPLFELRSKSAIHGLPRSQSNLHLV